MTTEKATDVSNLVELIKMKEAEVERFERAISRLTLGSGSWCYPIDDGRGYSDGFVEIVTHDQAIMMAMFNKANLEAEIKSLYKKLESL